MSRIVILLSVAIFLFSAVAQDITLSDVLYPQTKIEVSAYAKRLTEYSEKIIAEKKLSGVDKDRVLQAKEFAFKKVIFEMNSYKEKRKAYLQAIATSGLLSANTSYKTVVDENTKLSSDFLLLSEGTALVATNPTPTPAPVSTVAPTPISTTDKTAPSATPPVDRANFFHLAVVPYQTVTTATFEVQAIAEYVNPDLPPTAPIVTDASGTMHTMALKSLQWPDGSGPSVQIYAAVVPLVAGQLNNIKVTFEGRVLQLPITQKSALTIRTVTDSAGLRNEIKAAIADPTIDGIQIAYNEPDLGKEIVGVGNGVTNKRTTWLTLVPAAGNTVTWNRDYPGTASTSRRPVVDLLNLKGITFGSASSDGGGYQLYTENGYRLWLSEVQFLGKYIFSVPSTTAMTPVDYKPDVRFSDTGGQKIYFTDCFWKGTANVATYGAELARDLRFDSHRGDFNNFGKVFLNVVAKDIDTIRISSDLDVYHNDGFQLFSSAAPTSNLVFKGFKVTKQNVSTNLQPMFATGGPFLNVLVDSVFITGASTAVVLQTQFSGTWSNSRISNVLQDQQFFTIRQDGSFIPTNVYMQNIDVKKYAYCSPTQPGCTGAPTISIANGYLPDVTSYFQAIPGLSGITFSNMRLH